MPHDLTPPPPPQKKNSSSNSCDLKNHHRHLWSSLSSPVQKPPRKNRDLGECGEVPLIWCTHYLVHQLTLGVLTSVWIKSTHTHTFYTLFDSSSHVWLIFFRKCLFFPNKHSSYDCWYVMLLTNCLAFVFMYPHKVPACVHDLRCQILKTMSWHLYPEFSMAELGG